MHGLAEAEYFSSVAQWGARLKAREISAVELAKAFCARLEALGPRYNALALPLTKRALRKAKDIDGDIKRDRWRSPLQGIPCGVKDLLSVAGLPTTWGAKPYAAQVFKTDATVVSKLDSAGAVLTGKLSMVELAGGGGYCYPAASLFGPGLNPWNLGHWSGGSSSGSGSAVAAGLVPFAIGSETWGSILTPAAFCGVTGLRPTYGFVSRNGAMALSWTMDKIGPICRSAEDCGLVLQAIAGKDSGDPSSSGRSFYFAPHYARKPELLRVGYAEVDFSGWAEPSARPAFEKAFATLKEMGVRLIGTGLPELPYGLAASAIIAAEGSAIFEPLIESGKVDELADKNQIAGLKAGLDLSAKDYLKAMRIRTLVQQALHKLFADVDILVSPARFGPASKIGDRLDLRPPVSPTPADRGLSDLGAAGNLAGLPALCLPCGFSEEPGPGNALPLALQFVGRPFSENTLLSAGMAFQERTDWHKRTPKV